MFQLARENGYVADLKLSLYTTGGGRLTQTSELVHLLRSEDAKLAMCGRKRSQHRCIVEGASAPQFAIVCRKCLQQTEPR